MKTKLGISVAMLTAIIYCFGLFGGYVALALLIGYILLNETEDSLKKAAVKTVFICIAFDLLNAVIGLIPNGITILNNLFSMFGGSFYIRFLSYGVAFVTSILTVIEKLIFLILAFMAFSGKECRIPGLDDFIEKHM